MSWAWRVVARPFLSHNKDKRQTHALCNNNSTTLEKHRRSNTQCDRTFTSNSTPTPSARRESVAVRSNCSYPGTQCAHNTTRRVMCQVKRCISREAACFRAHHIFTPARMHLTVMKRQMAPKLGMWCGFKKIRSMSMGKAESLQNATASAVYARDKKNWLGSWQCTSQTTQYPVAPLP